MPTRQRITEQITELPSGPVVIVGQASTRAPRRKILALSLYSGLLENSCTAQLSVSHMIAPVSQGSRSHSSIGPFTRGPGDHR